MKKLAYMAIDGSTAIITPAPKADIEKVTGPLTDEQYEALVRERSIPKEIEASDVIELDDDSIPTDREFRNAWKLQDNRIDFDLPKAKEIQLERIRKAREPHLTALERAHMEALIKGQDVTEIINQKQALLEITEPLKALEPESIDDIKNAFPEELTRPIPTPTINSTEVTMSSIALDQLFTKIKEHEGRLNNQFTRIEQVEILANKVDETQSLSLPKLDSLETETRGTIKPKVTDLDGKSISLEQRVAALEAKEIPGLKVRVDAIEHKLPD